MVKKLRQRLIEWLAGKDLSVILNVQIADSGKNLLVGTHPDALVLGNEFYRFEQIIIGGRFKFTDAGYDKIADDVLRIIADDQP
jgi:hypothetical protein